MDTKDIETKAREWFAKKYLGKGPPSGELQAMVEFHRFMLTQGQPDSSKIREAGNALRARCERYREAMIEDGFKQISEKVVAGEIEAWDLALSDLDTRAVRQPLSEEHIERLGDERRADVKAQKLDDSLGEDYIIGYKSGLRYARDRGYLREPERSEPVAWMYPSGETKHPIHLTLEKEIAYEECRDAAAIRPLYAHPAPKEPSPISVQPSDAVIAAANAVINRWDSPQWEWEKHGNTGNLITDLRNALSALSEGKENGQK